MARYLLLALNGPTKGEGDEATYNRWYDEVHVPDLLDVAGIKSARRFKIIQSKGVRLALRRRLRDRDRRLGLDHGGDDHQAPPLRPHL